MKLWLSCETLTDSKVLLIKWGGGVEIKWGGGVKCYTNFQNVWGSLLNAVGGENFEKMQFDPSLQLDTKEYQYQLRCLKTKF